MTEEKRKEFEEITKPIMKWLNDNFHPHAQINITTTHCEMLFGEASYTTDEFVQD